MSARLIQILASLAQRRALRGLDVICETQHQISTRKLEQYLEQVGDELAGNAHYLRIEYDALTSKVATLEAENAKLRAAAPRQPEGEGLEMVAYLLIDDPTDGESGDWDITVVSESAERMAQLGGGRHKLCRLSDAQRAIAELREEISDLHTTMMAAAVEIQEHWQAHCDEEGYGPVNLMHRLERGIASLYGYTARTLVQAEAERDKLAGLLREVLNWSEPDLEQRIKTALAEVNK